MKFSKAVKYCLAQSFLLPGSILLIVISLPGCSQPSAPTDATQQQSSASDRRTEASRSPDQQIASNPETQAQTGPEKNSLFNKLDNTNNQIQVENQMTSSANVVTTASGLQYEDLSVGSGTSPQPGQRVTVHYTGWLTNGTKFDSSVDRGSPFQFVIGTGQVIKGWDEGVASMKVGGKRKLTIPAELGYGQRGAGDLIPPGATLVFEVDLLGVQ